jgi:hypothetical protein
MTMFRLLPPFGQDPRGVAEVVNGIMNGKTNNTGTVTLATGNALTTTLVDERISIDTKIILIPFSDAAEADSAPYGGFSDTTDQAATTISDSYAMKYDTTDYSNGVYVSDNSRINFRNYGVYAIQYSAQFRNTTNDGQDVDIWFRKNGTDITSSNSRFHIVARKSSGADSHLVATSTFLFELDAGDYVEVVFRVSNIGVSLEHFAAVSAGATTPDIPATPSIIVTAQYVAPLAYSNVYVSSQQSGQATISHFANNTADKTYAYILVG